MLDQRFHCLAPVRRKCANIDKPHHLGVGTRFGNHDAPIRMPDKDDWAILRGNDPLCYGHVVGERESGILHDGNVVAFLLQYVVNPSHPEPSTKPPWISTMFL